MSDDEADGVSDAFRLVELERARRARAAQRAQVNKVTTAYSSTVIFVVGLLCLAVALTVALLINHKTSGTPPTNSQSGTNLNIPHWFWFVVASFLGIAAIATAIYLGFRVKATIAANARAEEAEARQSALDHKALKELQSVTELATLLDLNQRQLDRYHEIATFQADKSFRSSQRAMLTGLTVIVGCAVAGVTVDISQVRWFLGALGAVGAAFSAYLNKTYVGMYKESLGQLNRYFDQPVLSSYYLTAERLASGIKDDGSPEGMMRQEIIRQVLSTSDQLGVTSRTSSNAASRKRPSRTKQTADDYKQNA